MSSDAKIDPQIVETDDMKSVEADWNSMLDRIAKIICENKVAPPNESKEIVNYLRKRIKHIDSASPHLLLTDGPGSIRNDEIGNKLAVYIRETYVKGYVKVKEKVEEKIFDKILVDVYNLCIDSKSMYENSIQMGIEKRPVKIKKRFLRGISAVYRMKYFV
jgi:hypothetical protein